MILPKGQMVPQGDSQPGDVRAGKKFMSSGSFAAKTGTMPDNGSKTFTPSNASVLIPAGYYGASTVSAVTFDASKVLTGTTIANTAGTMPNKTGTEQVTAWGNSASDTEIFVTVPQGYYPGGQQNLKINDNNLLASNIMSGVVILGVEGTATNDATATAEDIAVGKIAYANGQRIVGTRTT
jgi:hypothetical protein